MSQNYSFHEETNYQTQPSASQGTILFRVLKKYSGGYIKTEKQSTIVAILITIILTIIAVYFFIQAQPDTVPIPPTSDI